MNKIFKLKKSSNGLKVVSEIAKSHSGEKVVSSGFGGSLGAVFAKFGRLGMRHDFGFGKIVFSLATAIVLSPFMLSEAEANILCITTNNNTANQVRYVVFANNADGNCPNGFTPLQNGTGVSWGRATATGNNAFAVGHGAYGSGANLTESNSSASGDGSVAFIGGQATGNYSFAVIGGKTVGVNSIAMGVNSIANGENSLAALGGLTNTNGKGAIAIGEGAVGGHEYTIALGKNAFANTTNTISIGNDSQAMSQYSIGLGTNAHATAPNAAAIGANSYATRTDSLAMGVGATAGIADGQVLFQSNSTNIINDGKPTKLEVRAYTQAEMQTMGLGSATKTYYYLGYQSNNGFVKVGGLDRDIDLYQAGATLDNTTGIVTGTLRTDLIQSYSFIAGEIYNNPRSHWVGNANAEAVVANNIMQYIYNNRTSSKFQGAAYIYSNTIGDNQVAIGPNSYAAGNVAVAMGNNALALGSDTIAIGNDAQAVTLLDGTIGNIAIGGHARAMEINTLDPSDRPGQSTAIGYDAQATGGQAMALGANTRATGYGSIAIGGDDIGAEESAPKAEKLREYIDFMGGTEYV
ncbi:MAG: hypothetical protein J6W17_03925, partial [Campylobacter sp.]|nr:hypothetical protein [Campylobacter sp.]